MGIPLGRCFVTGAAGFIGSHLVDRLLADGHRVTGLDNLSTGKASWLAHLDGDPRFTLVQGSVLDRDLLRQSMTGHDTVFHLAANGDISAALVSPRVDFEQGVVATYNIIEAIKETGVRRLAFTSSGSVLGLIDQVPTPEAAGPLLPISMYAGAKLAAEALISAAANTYDFQAWIFRFGNVVGGRMSRGVIYDFIQKTRRTPDELEILGNGEQEKNYILVEEVVDCILYCLRSIDVQMADVFHLGAPDSLKVTEIARIVVEEMGLPDVRFCYTGGVGGWKGDQPVAIFDVSKLRRLGWAPKHASAEAVRIAVRRILEQERGVASPQTVGGNNSDTGRP